MMPKILAATKIAIFRRDRWLCHWCRKPVIFHPAMKLLEQYVRESGVREPLAYFDLRWRRDGSPLLDELAAVIDHRNSLHRGGSNEEPNFVTACNRCNIRKSAT